MASKNKAGGCSDCCEQEGCMNESCDGEFHSDCFDFVHFRWLTSTNSTFSVSGGRGELHSVSGPAHNVVFQYGFSTGTDGEIVLNSQIFSVGDKGGIWYGSLLYTTPPWRITADWVTGDVECYHVSTEDIISSVAVDGGVYKIVLTETPIGSNIIRSCFYVDDTLIAEFTDTWTTLGVSAIVRFGLHAEGNPGDQIGEWDNFCFGNVGPTPGCTARAVASAVNADAVIAFSVSPAIAISVPCSANVTTDLSTEVDVLIAAVASSADVVDVGVVTGVSALSAAASVSSVDLAVTVSSTTATSTAVATSSQEDISGEYPAMVATAPSSGGTPSVGLTLPVSGALASSVANDSSTGLTVVTGEAGASAVAVSSSVGVTVSCTQATAASTANMADVVIGSTDSVQQASATSSATSCDLGVVVTSTQAVATSVVGTNDIAVTVSVEQACAASMANSCDVETEMPSCDVDSCEWECQSGTWVVITDPCAVGCICGDEPVTVCDDPPPANESTVCVAE